MSILCVSARLLLFRSTSPICARLFSLAACNNLSMMTASTFLFAFVTCALVGCGLSHLSVAASPACISTEERESVTHSGLLPTYSTAYRIHIGGFSSNGFACVTMENPAILIAVFINYLRSLKSDNNSRLIHDPKQYIFDIFRL